MASVLRCIAIFVPLYLAACLAVSAGLPRLQAWHFANCTASSAICSASMAFLAYWWFALLPVLVVITLLANRALARRRAA